MKRRWVVSVVAGWALTGTTALGACGSGRTERSAPPSTPPVTAALVQASSITLHAPTSVAPPETVAPDDPLALARLAYLVLVAEHDPDAAATANDFARVYTGDIRHYCIDVAPRIEHFAQALGTAAWPADVLPAAGELVAASVASASELYACATAATPQDATATLAAAAATDERMRAAAQAMRVALGLSSGG